MVALWRSITDTWGPPTRPGFGDEEVDCLITDYTKEIESNPSDVTAYLARGTAHLEAFAFDRAIADFTKAIELKPNNDSAYTKRGGAHYEKGEYDRAISDLTNALKINSRSALAHSNLGWTYEAIGDEKRAIAHYRMALEIDPSLEEPRDNLKLLGAISVHQFFSPPTKRRFPSNRFR